MSTSQIRKKPESNRFTVDGMLGKIAKWLRMLGFDTKYSVEKPSELLYKEALREGRIFITRNTKLKDKKNVIFIKSDNPFQQFSEILKTFDLKKQMSPFTRCMVCNEPLLPVEKKKVKDKVPFYTFENFNEFYECPSCGRVYWKGTHYFSMSKRLEELFGDKN